MIWWADDELDSYITLRSKKVKIITKPNMTFAVKHRTLDLKTSDKRKLGPGNVRKIEESARILMVKSRGCRNFVGKIAGVPEYDAIFW
jgi:hypothetical protein